MGCEQKLIEADQSSEDVLATIASLTMGDVVLLRYRDDGILKPESIFVFDQLTTRFVPDRHILGAFDYQVTSCDNFSPRAAIKVSDVLSVELVATAKTAVLLSRIMAERNELRNWKVRVMDRIWELLK